VGNAYRGEGQTFAGRVGGGGGGVAVKCGGNEGDWDCQGRHSRQTGRDGNSVPMWSGMV